MWVSISVTSEYYKHSAQILPQKWSLLNWYGFCSHIKKQKCQNSGQRHAFIAFLCNMQLVFFTFYSSVRASQEQITDNKHKEWWFKVPYLIPFLILCVIGSTTYKDLVIKQLVIMCVWQKTFPHFWAKAYVKRKGITISLALTFWFCLHSQSQIIIFNVAVQN